MSSCTVTVTSSTSTLRSTLFPPLHLRDDRQWEIALLDFTTYNSIPNIIEGVNNRFHYVRKKDTEGLTDVREFVEIKTGSYEIADINRELQIKLGKDVFDLRANNNNLRSEIKCKFYMDFTQPASIGPLLGFPSCKSILEPNIYHTSPKTVNIIKVNTINITCNIVQGAYKDGSNQHILHSFYPTVPPGFKIVEKPHNLIYLPLNSSHISDIVLNVLDQDGDTVDFRGEIITLRLHIRQAP
jgi:hypothetical protein